MKRPWGVVFAALLAYSPARANTYVSPLIRYDKSLQSLEILDSSGTYARLCAIDPVNHLCGRATAAVRGVEDFATTANPFGSGGDDTLAWQHAITWLLSGGGHKTLTVPGGSSTSSASLGGAVTGTKEASLILLGTQEVTFADGVDGFAFTRDWTAGVSVKGHLRVVRSVAAGAIPENRAAFQVNINPASSTASGLPGRCNIDDLEVRASAVNYGWLDGLIMSSCSNGSLGRYIYSGANGPGTEEAFGASPTLTSSALWISGANPSLYSTDFKMGDIQTVGAHIGVRVNGYVQGVYFDRMSLIGNDYGIYWNTDLLAYGELLQGSTLHTNSAIRGVYSYGMGYGPIITTGLHLHFNPSPSSTWRAFELVETSGFALSNQTISGSRSTYLSGSPTGSEGGYLITAQGAAGGVPGSISGGSVQGVWGPWLQIGRTYTSGGPDTMSAVVVSGVAVNGVGFAGGAGAFSILAEKGHVISAIGINGGGDLFFDGQKVNLKSPLNTNGQPIIFAGRPQNVTWAKFGESSLGASKFSGLTLGYSDAGADVGWLLASDIYANGTRDFGLYNAATGQLPIFASHSTGYVGINNSNPQFPLDVVGGASAQFVQFKVYTYAQLAAVSPAPVAGFAAYCSDCIRPGSGEAAGAGSGAMIFRESTGFYTTAGTAFLH